MAKNGGGKFGNLRPGRRAVTARHLVSPTGPDGQSGFSPASTVNGSGTAKGRPGSSESARNERRGG